MRDGPTLVVLVLLGLPACPCWSGSPAVTAPYLHLGQLQGQVAFEMRAAFNLNCYCFSAAVMLYCISTFLNLMNFSVYGRYPSFCVQENSTLVRLPGLWGARPLAVWLVTALAGTTPLALAIQPPRPPSGSTWVLHPLLSPLTWEAVTSLVASLQSQEKATHPALWIWTWSGCF